MQPLISRLCALFLAAALVAVPALLPAAAPEAALAARKLEPPPNFRLEVQGVVQLLEMAHYNRDAVKPANYAGLLPDFMGSLDGQRLFFLESDRQGFLKANDIDLLYPNIKLGNIDAAYDIFTVYETRVRERAAWIAAELKKDIDLTGQDTYAPDRAKADWPANTAAADDLWRRRLKFDLIQEMLAPGSKSADRFDLDLKLPNLTPTTPGSAPMTVRFTGEFMPATRVTIRYEPAANADTLVTTAQLEKLFNQLIPAKLDSTLFPALENAEPLKFSGEYKSDTGIVSLYNPVPSTSAATKQLKELFHPKPSFTAPAKTLADAKAAVAKRYERLPKNVAELDASDLAEVFLTSVAQLYDPHSTYFSPTSYDDFSIQMQLQLVGIGALLSLEEDVCVVKELVPGGPADLGKQLKPNDKITAIAQDNKEPVDVIGMKLRKIVQMIRGNKGTKVHLFVESGEGTAAVRREVVIDRDVVNLDSSRAHAAVFTVPASAGQPARMVGVISLPSFYGSDPTPENPNPAIASKDIAELIKRLKTQNVQGLVLDLRHNGGGLLGEAINLTGLFIKSGPVVQVRDHEGKISSGQTRTEEIAWTGPLAVLVDRFSASASEIVAGALQNYGRAVIIGDSSTHGKGTVQTIVELSRLSRASLALQLSPTKTGAAKFTIQKFYLPNGASTQLRGVIPDLILPSVDDLLPIGESSLPHALGWDEIESAKFDGPALTAANLNTLRAASEARRRQLPEFSYLQSGVDWFKAKRDEKDISLNLARREKQKTADAEHKKLADAELKKLEDSAAYAFTETMLAPPPPPRIKVEDPEDPSAANPDERYPKMDIDLRESLRVVSDALNLPPQTAHWLPSGPSTAQTVTKPAPIISNTP